MGARYRRLAPVRILRLDEATTTAADADVSFDPVANPLPGLMPTTG